MATTEKLEVKILVLDDERLIRLTLCARLKQAGYDAIAVATVDEAVALLKKAHWMFNAIISDIVMGDMDGFVFRDIVRGIDSSMPFFFMTALDPEEGSGFLKKIIQDPMSYYLPKSAGTDVLIQRLRRVIGARRIQQFVADQVEEQKKSLALAAYVQQSMLPPRAMQDDRYFYAMWWRPHASVSGDMYEVTPLGDNRFLFMMGDIQGHGTNAALVMMAVQAFLRQTAHAHRRDNRNLTVEHVANRLHGFFRTNFAEVSYMTATICIFTPPEPGDETSGGEVSYISCGTADMLAINPFNNSFVSVNPEKRGGLPIGLMPDTVYTADDVVQTKLPHGTVCAIYTDGLLELSRDADETEVISRDLLRRIGMDLLCDAYASGAMMSVPAKFLAACNELGYTHYQDDVTIGTFGARMHTSGIYTSTTALSPSLVDAAAQEIGAWCARERWPEDLTGRVQLVLEEHLMNIYDHGFTDQQRRKDVVHLRLRRRQRFAELTIWDCGKPAPSLKVAAGTTETALDLANKNMQNHGRGRLMVRQLCNGIKRQSFGALNEATFNIPFEA